MKLMEEKKYAGFGSQFSSTIYQSAVNYDN